MNTQRMNIFEMIHKALRAMLYETGLLIQQTDFVHEDEMHLTFCKIQQVLDAFNSHAHHEDKFIIPAIVKYDPAIAAQIESEHGKDEQLGVELESKMEAFRFAASGEVKAEIASEILYLFVEFTAFNLTHMNKEEHLLNEVLWKHYTDEQIIEINMNIIKSIPVEEMMQSLGWMMKGISTLQLIKLLNIQKHHLPQQAFDDLITRGEQVVAPQRWAKVMMALKEESAIA